MFFVAFNKRQKKIVECAEERAPKSDKILKDIESPTKNGETSSMNVEILDEEIDFE